MKAALAALCLFAFALALSALPMESSGTTNRLKPLKERSTARTPLTTPTMWDEAASTPQERELQGQQTQATTVQTHRGRATPPPSKERPRPCSGCFSVIGNPPVTPLG